jgi:hypothetical protein
MFGPAEYHVSMRIRIPRPALFLALLVAPAFLLATAQAQVHGTPASVTSPGFGGRRVNGPAPSVTSLGPRGYSPHPPVTFSTVPNVPHGNRSGDGHHRRNQGQYYGPVLYAYPYSYYPYYDDQSGPPQEYGDSAANAENSDANYEGGPTIFDRRGSGERSYIPPVKNVAPSHKIDQPQPTTATDATESAPAPAADPTLLVFKDGHSQEVANYAIVGSTLFDLTPGRPRKIAIADLDLTATQKQNEDRGVNFQLPPSARVN